MEYFFFSDTILMILALNFTLSLALILGYHNHNISLCSSIISNQKENEYYKYSKEFLKLAGNFCLVNLILLVSIKYLPSHFQHFLNLSSCIMCVAIALRWNSTEFNRMAGSFVFNLFRTSPNDTKFNETLIADVWTSFAKSSTYIIIPSYPLIRTVVFW